MAALMNLPDWTLFCVLFLIAFRLVLGLRIAIWQIMSCGALVVIIGNSLTLTQAWLAIDWNVIGFLFGVFVLGHALVVCGLLHRVSASILGRIRSSDALVFTILVISGLSSALLMNDTIAVIGTPLMLSLARDHRLPPTLLLLALAFGVTIGSVPSPIGNPQNLLIAVHSAMPNPFWVFINNLAIPSLISLLLAWVVLRIAFWNAFHGEALLHALPEIHDKKLAHLAAHGLFWMITCIFVKIFLSLMSPPIELPLWIISAAACAPVLIMSRQRIQIIRHIDWHTLIFFIAMFILMRAVWINGSLNTYLLQSTSFTSISNILVISTLLSQLISNVPLVSLIEPLLQAHGNHLGELLALAVGSTIAGNLTLIGAASNVIIAQLAERNGVHLGFWQFVAVGAPLTIMCLLVYWCFL